MNQEGLKNHHYYVKKWINACKSNNLKTVYRPYLPFEFENTGTKCSWRLFDVNNAIYCTFSSDSDFIKPNGFTEIKASDFYKIMEDNDIQL